MCLAAIAQGQHPRFPWVLASNRDEFFDRAAAPLAWWQPAAGDEPVLGGRDLSAGGTWLGLLRSGPLALVTNVREPGHHLADAPSRGELVPLWLREEPVRAQPERLLQPARNGFNLLTADLSSDAPARWLSNRAAGVRELTGGVHGLSNAALDTPWPKVQQLKRQLQAAVPAAGDADAIFDAAFTVLADRAIAPDDTLPRTGVPLERERALSALFIRITAPDGSHALYGTRCSTVVVVEQRGPVRQVHVRERSVDAHGLTSGERRESFTLPGEPR
jgi:uncharacterized protein with NRDE domain